MNRQYFVYILTNRHHTVLYTGVTNDLMGRVFEHRNKLIPGFTTRYNADKLVFYEATSEVRAAITPGKTDQVRVSGEKDPSDRGDQSAMARSVSDTVVNEAREIAASLRSSQ